MYSSKDTIEGFDPELWHAIEQENRRQEDHIELIASENYASPRVLQAQGSVLTNKYAEGYPGKRYYGGCEFVDIAEQLAIDRAKKLFHAGYANVQPHSGAQANQAVYAAVLRPGDVILGMSLDAGGHLTHGSAVNMSGKYYSAVGYGLNLETEEIDYADVEELAHVHKPKLIIAGASAYSLAIDWKRFRAIADRVGALLMADMAHYAGLVAAGLYPSPVGIADFVTTTTHKTLRGPRGGMILCDAQLAKKVDSAVFPGGQGGPLMHVIAGKAVAFLEAARPSFREYCTQIVANARALADGMTQRGFRLVSGGTDVHLFLLSLVDRDVTGKQAQQVLEHAGITANKNMVPFDPRKPTVTSGVRLGTPAVTTRGMKEAEMGEIADCVARVLERPDDASVIAAVRAEVEALCRRFPLYPSRWSDAD